MTARPWWRVRIEELEREVEELRAVITENVAKDYRELVDRFRVLQDEPGEPVEVEGFTPRVLWVDPAHRSAFEELGIEVPE